VSKELVSTLSFLMTTREVGNVIFGIQILYHNHIIQVFLRTDGLFHPVEREGYK
jgi:hypothetical protein